MLKLKELADRFFGGNIELCKSIKLTEEEIKEFEDFELLILYDNGLKNINGGYSLITIDDKDEDYLQCRVECGVQDGNDGNKSYWSVTFDRKTKDFSKD